MVDFWNGLLVLALVFHGFWCFAYFACLSPSMGVMVELRARERGGISAEEALAMHGREQPVNLIFQRRLPKLVQGGYVREEGGAYRLLPRGGRIAALGAFLKRLINSEAPVAGEPDMLKGLVLAGLLVATWAAGAGDRCSSSARPARPLPPWSPGSPPCSPRTCFSTC